MPKFMVTIRHTMFFHVPVEAENEEEAEALAWDIWDHDLDDPAEENSTCESIGKVKPLAWDGKVRGFQTLPRKDG